LKKSLTIILISFLLVACFKYDNSKNIFKEGTFELPAGKNFSATTIIRKDSFQIEQYGDRVDTLIIHWKNNFAYNLKMLRPKTDFDKEVIHVKIKKIHNKSYDFEAKVGYSNFIQKGTIRKK